MATINLLSKYAPKLDERYRLGSLTDAACGTDYDWNGVNSIQVLSLFAPDLNDYDSSAAANRFGTPSEVDDELNVYTLNQKKSFSKTFDVTNVHDQGFLKKAVSYLKQAWDESYVPAIDKYRFKTWANGAGLGTLNTTALTKSTIVEAILTAHAELDDAGVPSQNRFTFVRSDLVVKFKLADEFKGDGALMTKFVIRNNRGTVNDGPMISVPKFMFPKGVNFIVKYKKASADPVKMRLLRANDNAPGYAGTLMEGLVRYDSFVIAHKADGIYVHSASNKATNPTITITDSSAAITAGVGESIKYTVDGTNPKTSETAEAYSDSFDVTVGQHIRAYAYKAGIINSAVVSQDVE